METQLQAIARLIGDPVRSAILWILLDGKAYTASELAAFTGTTLPNISMHLNKLTAADLLTVEKQGRHHYFRFSRDEVAYTVEGLANLVPKGELKKHTGETDLSDFQYCRTCYDHLAGRVGVMLTEQLLRKKFLRLNGHKLFDLTTKGSQFFKEFKIDVEELRDQRRIFAKPCLDWSERKYHLAGALGAAVLEKMLQNDWLRNKKNSRDVVITGKGRKEMTRLFEIGL